MSRELERRFVTMRELRGGLAGGSSRLSGYAAVFGVDADILGMFTERIAQGAFARSIRENDVRALWNHDSALVLGRTTNGTLKLREDSVGLPFELDLPDTTWGRDAAISVRRGDVTGMSFGFSVPKGGDEWSTIGGKRLRILRSIDLEEISPVTFPAFKQTSVKLTTLAPASDEAPRDRSSSRSWKLDHMRRREYLIMQEMSEDELLELNLARARRQRQSACQ